jgi:hypothetical protein
MLSNHPIPIPPLSPDTPSAYEDGHRAAILVDRDLADRYVAATRLGDPAADAVVAELARHDPTRGETWLRLAMEGGPAAIPDAPEVVRAFFATVEQVPDWFDPNKVLPGCRAFHRDSEMFIGAFVASV